MPLSALRCELAPLAASISISFLFLLVSLCVALEAIGYCQNGGVEIFQRYRCRGLFSICLQGKIGEEWLGVAIMGEEG